jgi:hypothetical protein
MAASIFALAAVPCISHFHIGCPSHMVKSGSASAISHSTRAIPSRTLASRRASISVQFIGIPFLLTRAILARQRASRKI